MSGDNDGRHGREEREAPIVRDKRRLDPTTGAVREQVATPAPDAGAPPAGGLPDATGAPAAPDGAGAAGAQGAPVDSDGIASEVDTLRSQLAERTIDLQRLQAEYANYRKRVDRDRAVVVDNAVASVLVGLLPVLDDVGRAREHGELEGGFKAVSDALETTVEKLGLVRFGKPGEPFDPNQHEALMHQGTSAEVSEPTCVMVLQPGYRLVSAAGDRILRPARVAVADPE